MLVCTVDENEVFWMLNKLDKSKSCGPNSITTNLLRTHANALVLPLKLAINQSFSEGIFPDLLKIAKVCPVFKKRGDKFERKLQAYLPSSKFK